MKDIDMHLRYFDYLYKQGIIKKDTHAQVTRDILADRRTLVSIKSVFDDNYVSIDGESNILYTHTDKFGISERLYFINLGNGSALLQSYDGYYVRANPSNNVLVASEVESSNATVFTLIPISQKEVALKLTEGKTVSPLTLLIDAVGSIEYCFTVSKNVFMPAPHVDSAIIHIEMNDICNDKLYKVINASFKQKRKTIYNNLKELFGDKTKEILNQCGIDEKKRAEQLSIEEYRKVSKYL